MRTMLWLAVMEFSPAREISPLHLAFVVCLLFYVIHLDNKAAKEGHL